jgi:hypothetical protein
MHPAITDIPLNRLRRACADALHEREKKLVCIPFPLP